MGEWRRAAPTRCSRARCRGSPTGAGTCATGCGTWSGAVAVRPGRAAGRPALAAHRIADAVYEKLTGEKGVFSTRIAYVTKAGSRYTLWVADADGEGGQAALSSPEPIISRPGLRTGASSPTCRSGTEPRHGGLGAGRLQRPGACRQLPRFQQRAGVVARRFATWRSRCRATAARRSTCSTGGSNTPPDDRPAIDTEPVFAPDGKSLFFVSDRGGVRRSTAWPAWRRRARAHHVYRWLQHRPD